MSAEDRATAVERIETLQRLLEAQPHAADGAGVRQRRPWRGFAGRGAFLGKLGGLFGGTCQGAFAGAVG